MANKASIIIILVIVFLTVSAVTYLAMESLVKPSAPIGQKSESRVVPQQQKGSGQGNVVIDIVSKGDIK